MNTVKSSDSNALITWGWTTAEHRSPSDRSFTLRKPANLASTLFTRVDLLKPLRHWLDGIQFSNVRTAHQVCQLVPAQCPFERDVTLFGHVLFHIPPMCKLNPLYDEVVGLRFRALCYLADECGEDISAYC